MKLKLYFLKTIKINQHILLSENVLCYSGGVMKKFFFLFLGSLMIIFIIPTNAQIKLGLQSGINLADLNFDPLLSDYETSNRTGYMIGGIFNYEFTSVLSLQVEPTYIQKGASLDISIVEDGMNIEAEATYSANYIDIPVLLKASFGKSVRPFLLAGTSIGLLLGDVKINIDKVTANGQDVTSHIPGEAKEHIQQSKSLDFLLNFGGGVEIPVGEVNIIIEGQYNLGLSDINDEPNDNTKIKNKGIQLKAGVLFSL